MARRVFDILQMSANRTRSMIIHSFIENLLIVTIALISIFFVALKLVEQL